MLSRKFQTFIKLYNLFKEENNQLNNNVGKSIQISFFLKLLSVTLWKKVFKKNLDINSKLVTHFSVIVFFPIRFTLIKLIKMIDKLSLIPFGSETIFTKRILRYANLELIVRSRDKGVDQRNLIWKRSALAVILSYLSKIQKQEFVFLEIGAASGIVSLFVGLWGKSKNLDYQIYSVEPSLPNICFLEESSELNKVQINILPFALDENSKWITFTQGFTKGYVGEDASSNAQKDFLVSRKPSISFELMKKSYVKHCDICYVDAFMNEVGIIKKMLINYPATKAYIIEFDNGLNNSTVKMLNESGYKLIKKDHKFNYLFVKG